MLAAPGTQGSLTAAGDSQQQQTNSFESGIATSLQDMLSQVIGPNHAVVRVTADLNYDQKASTTETYPNNTPVPLNQTTTKETYTGQGTPPAIGTLSASPTTLPSSVRRDHQLQRPAERHQLRGRQGHPADRAGARRREPDVDRGRRRQQRQRGRRPDDQAARLGCGRHPVARAATPSTSRSCRSTRRRRPRPRRS